jgi:vibriolysin
MDSPTKDCGAKQPGDNCSIDHASQFKAGMQVQRAAGVYNKAIYLLSTTAGWSVTKAYNVMLAANMHYWISTTNFDQGACGMKRAAADMSYDTKAVVAAFNAVGVSTAGC